MKKILGAAIAVAAAFGGASAANAAQTLVITGASGTFGDDQVTCATGTAAPCTFERTFTFTTPAGFTLASADITSNFTGSNMATNLDFSSVTLNGTNFNILSTGQQEFRNLLNQSLAAGGTNTILVRGTTGGDAAFSGTLSFAGSAVPEPATWAMMLVGFGAIGGAMRRRNTTARVKFA